MRSLAMVALAGVALAHSPTTLAQDAPERLRVFLDCHLHGCDFDHFRREIAFAAWVRQREDAQVHVLITVEPTGGGGQAYTLAFIGAGTLAGREDTLTYLAGATDTESEVRDGLTRVLSLGLVGYAARLGDDPRLGVTYRVADTSAAAAASGLEDPWDYWAFRVRAGGFLNGERQQRFRNFEGGVSGSRVTEALKLEFGASASYGRDEFDTEDRTIVSTQTTWDLFAIGVIGLGRHWSAGGVVSTGGATFRNQDLTLFAGPAIEYSVFPYSQSTRRLLTIQFVIAGAYYNYADTTIFDRVSEAHPLHLLEAELTQREPWGTVRTSAEWWQFWHDWHRHSLELFAQFEIRIVRGLSFDLSGRVQRVKDQIYLPKEDLTPEEVLLRRRELGTDYRYSLNVGLSYRFGSAFNNVVNPRLR